MNHIPFTTRLAILAMLLAHAAMAVEVAITPANPADLCVNVVAGELALPGGKTVKCAAARLVFDSPEIRDQTLDAKASRNYAPWYEGWSDAWPSLDYASGTINAIDLKPHAAPDGAMILGNLFRMILPESVKVTNADGSKTFKMNEDYKYNADYGQIANLNSRLGEEFKADLHISFQYASQRLDLMQVGADGKVTVKKGEPAMVCPALPEADAGCAALAGIYIAPWKKGSSYAVAAEDINLIHPAPPVQPVNGKALARTRNKLVAGRTVTIGFIGDSITAGAEAPMWWANQWTDKNLSYPSRVVTGLRQQYPKATITPAAAMQGGSTTKFGVDNLAKLLPSKPDLIVISFMANDAGGPKNGQPSNPPDKFKADLRAMITKAKAAGAEVLLVVTMPQNPHQNNVAIPRLPAYRQAMIDLATEENVGAADCYTEWEHLASRGIPPFSQLHNLINHPGKAGHKLFAEVVLRFFVPQAEDASVPDLPPPAATQAEAAAPATPKAESSEADWCTIATPATASAGTPIEIKVTLKAGVQPAKLSVHLHWMKSDGGFGGFLSWAPPQDAKGGETYTFTHNPTLTAAMGSIASMAFLSPDGEYSHRTKEAAGKGMPIVAEPTPAASSDATSKTQPTVIPGKFAITAQPFPPLAAVIAQPLPDRPVYGLYLWTEEFQRLREEVRKAGWKQLRIGGTWDDTTMRMVVEDDIDVMLVTSSKDRSAYASDDAFIAANLANTEALLNRYGPRGSFFKDNPRLPVRPITALEIWNEPNSQYMIPDRQPATGLEQEREALYAKLLPVTYQLIKSKWPEVRVIGFSACGMEAGDLRFVEHVKNHDPARIPHSFDFFSTHPYVDPCPPDADSIRSWGSYSAAKSLATIRTTLGAPLLPVWYTEVGWRISQADGGRYPTIPGEPLATPMLQAAYICRSYAQAMRLGVGRVFIMHAFDTDNFNGGLFVRETLSWRPSAHAAQTMIATMPFPKLVGAINDGTDGWYAWNFIADARKAAAAPQVTMAFAVAGPKHVELPWTAPAATVVDMLGATSKITASSAANGKWTLPVEIGPYPVYLAPAQP